MDHQTITKAIIKSQHCQRNWDLTQEIPQADLDLILTAATQCPSKQNVAFYKTHFITNREIIETIHSQTFGFGKYSQPSFGTNNTRIMEYTTNSKTLAILIVVFEEYEFSKDPIVLNDQTDMDEQQLLKNNEILKRDKERDREMAVGVAAGYLNFTAHLIGYSTGYCACFNTDAIREILGLDGKPLLLIGIGYSDPDRDRRVHHSDPNFIFPAITKQPIPVNYVN
jgi:nitroreductase